ncbi:hypothetical protein JHK87_029683 [Glycine soja]|nr:hypothetical protein JHK87_029683 [Glycine soja]
MAKPESRTNLASCFVATIFLIFLLIVVFIVYFTVFKPQDPKIAVSAVQIPSFSATNGTVNFTFSQYASVRNPNRGTFSHYDSSLQLLYYGRQVGFMFVPAGRTQYMAATFTVQFHRPVLPLGPRFEVSFYFFIRDRHVDSRFYSICFLFLSFIVAIEPIDEDNREGVEETNLSHEVANHHRNSS